MMAHDPKHKFMERKEKGQTKSCSLRDGQPSARAMVFQITAVLGTSDPVAAYLPPLALFIPPRAARACANSGLWFELPQFETSLL